MFVKKQDTGIFPGKALSNQLAIDLDNDYVNDFVFNYSGISKPMWSITSIELTSASNGCQISGTFGVDTTYLLETIETGTSQPTAYSSITNYTVHTLNYSCSRTSAQSKVSSINQHAFRVKAPDSLAHLANNSNFGNDTLRIFYFNQSNIPNQISSTQMLTEKIINRTDCGTFTNNQHYYIGIRIHKKNKDYLGWIKFLYVNNSIKLLETAIQHSP
jgi:hypothetical protein